MNIKYLFIIPLVLLSCETEEQNTFAPTPKETESKSETSLLSSKIIFKEDIGWGYQIFEGNKMVINQEHIPAVQGMHGFNTKEHAEIAADFVLNKIKNGLFPPTLTPDELDSMGIYSEKEEIK